FLRGELGKKHRHAGDVAARPRETCDMTQADRVGVDREDDGNCRGPLPGRFNEGRRRGEDHIDGHARELGRKCGQLPTVLRPSPPDEDVVARDVAQVAQARPQAISCKRLGDKAEKSDAWQLRTLLRARGEQQKKRRYGRAGEQRDELPPFHSITSSARASSVGGTSRPSAAAVCRLMTNSNLVGCRIGSSAGFSPLSTPPV